MVKVQSPHTEAAGQGLRYELVSQNRQQRVQRLRWREESIILIENIRNKVTNSRRTFLPRLSAEPVNLKASELLT